MSKWSALLHVTGGAGAGSPVGGMAGWYKADGESYSDTNPVGTVTDFSGLALHLTAAGAARPIFRTNQIAGKPVFRFDGVDDNAQVTGFNWGSTGGCTMHAVFKCSSAVAFGMVFTALRVSPNYFQELRMDAAGTSGQFVGGNNSVTATNILNTFRVVSGLYSQSDTTLRIYYEATEIATAAGSGDVSANTFQMGSRAGGLFFNGDIAEVIVYSSALDAGQRAQNVSYLRGKYSL